MPIPAYLPTCLPAASHGHHGQLPAAEYLVATAAHSESHESGGTPRFLPWHDFMALCLEWGLPLNDVWLIAGRPHAEAARQLLDDLALRGGPTSEWYALPGGSFAGIARSTPCLALGAPAHVACPTPSFKHNKIRAHKNGVERRHAAYGHVLLAAMLVPHPPAGVAVEQLHALVADGGAAGAVHLPGTYPHAQWQGERIEGFVVAQGDAVSEAASERLRSLRGAMEAQVLPLEAVAPHLRTPYADMVKAQQQGLPPAAADGPALPAGGQSAPGAIGAAAEQQLVAAVQQACAGWLPPTTSAAAYRAAPAQESQAVMQALRHHAPAAVAGAAAAAATGSVHGGPYSRASLAAAGWSGLAAALSGALEGAAQAAAGADGGAAARVAALQEVLARVQQAAAAAPQQDGGRGSTIEDMLVSERDAFFIGLRLFSLLGHTCLEPYERHAAIFLHILVKCCRAAGACHARARWRR